MSVIDMFGLDGKVIVVTGASAGLGVEFAVACAEAGADLVLAARSADRLDRTAELVVKAGRKATVICTDITKPDDCRRMIDHAMTTYGRVDVLMNNAGVGAAVPALRETPEHFRSLVDINLNGTYWAAQSAARVMEPGSAIINISSALAITTAGMPQAAYSASKSGVIGLTRDLAQQWGTRKGIRVNAIAPGFFASEMTAQYPDTYVDELQPRFLLGRSGDPRELAATLVWLASDAAGYVTGQTVVVDGGVSIT